MRTLNWGRAKFKLGNQQVVELTFAVVDSLPWPCVLGLPFFFDTQVVADFPSAVLTNSKGDIPLTTQPNRRATICAASAATINATSNEEVLPYPYSEPKLKEISIVPNVKNPEEIVEEVCSVGEFPVVKEDLRRLLLEYQDLWVSDKPAQCTVIRHVIELLHERPVVERPRHHCEEHRKIIREQTEKMLQDKVIRPSFSAFATEPVLVRKKDGPWRVCMDYRKLNEQTAVDKYPLPRIADLLRTIKGATVFSAIDLRAGYWNIPMEEQSKPYTAFRGINGLYEYEVMPFGLKNAPATFQRAMDVIFKDLIVQGTLRVYLDDILISAATGEEHLRVLEEVFRRLQRFGLRVNLPKSFFLRRFVDYLGHRVGAGKLQPQERKVAAIRKIRPPRNASELRHLLGVLSYYRQYIPKFANCTAPLTHLLKKGVPFKWTEKHTKAQQDLINQLADAVLNLPLDNDNFVVETDASDFAAGCILSAQRGETLVPVEFASTTFTDTQRRWPTREKEGYAIVWGLKKLDPYLRGRTFKLYTDHQSLIHMMSAKTGKLARWTSTLAEYNFTLFHKSGISMGHVDLLSRLVQEEDPFLPDRASYHPELSVMPIFIEVEGNDSKRSSVVSKDSKPSNPCFTMANQPEEYVISTPPLTPGLPPTTDPPIPTLSPFPSFATILKAQQQTSPQPTGAQFSIHGPNKVIFYGGKLWIPPELRLRVIAACHLVPPLKHVGRRKTVRLIQATCNWPNLQSDVASYLHSCLICQRLRPRIEELQGQHLPVPPPTALFERVYIDHWGPCHWVNGSPSVLTILDASSRWVECLVVPNQQAKTTAEAFLLQWCCRYGVPSVVFTDKGPAFNEVFHIMANLLGSAHLRSTARHPEGNALVETFHRTLRKHILAYYMCNTTPDLNVAVQFAAYAYRSTIHLGLGDSPAFITFGQDLRPPMEQDWRFLRSSNDSYRCKVMSHIRLQQFERAHALYQFNLHRDAPRRTHHLFEVGDLVLCHLNSKDRLQMARQEGALKVVPHWGLPCRVISVLYKGKTAIVKSLLTSATREVHVQDARFISPPRCPQLRQQWMEVAAKYLQTIGEPPDSFQKHLDEFWTEIQPGSASSLSNTPPAKRSRKGSLVSSIVKFPDENSGVSQ